MPTGQQYGTNVPQTTLTSAILAGTTTISVQSSSGFPATPFTAAFALGQSTQEPIDVTNVSGTTWTITRAIDNTTAFAQASNTTITHVDIGRDFREARAHIDATGPTDSTGKSVHGLATASSVVVGTLDTQPVDNKTYLGISGLTGATTKTRYTGGTAGGPPSSGTFNTGDHVVDTVYNTEWLCTAGGSPGTWIPTNGRVLLVSTSLSGASNSSTSIILPAVASNFKTLRIEYDVQMSGTAAQGAQLFEITFNNNASANYQWIKIAFTDGGAANSIVTQSTNAQTQGIIGFAWNSNTGSPTNGSGRGFVEMPGFRETTFNKTWFWQSAAGDGTTTGLSTAGSGNGAWNNTGAVSNLQVFTAASGTWVSPSVVNVYGLY